VDGLVFLLFLPKGLIIAVSHETEYLLMGLSTGLVLLMILFAWVKFRNYREAASNRFGKLLENKWYVDELYEAIIVQPLAKFAAFLRSWVETRIIDGLVNGVGRSVHYAGRQLRFLQSGQVGSYVLLMVVSMVLILFIQFFIRK
jgi:NADH-quinone oxidoreductase subunit L